MNTARTASLLKPTALPFITAKKGTYCPGKTGKLEVIIVIDLWRYTAVDDQIYVKTKDGETAVGYVVEVMDADEDDGATGDAIAIINKSGLHIFEDYEIEEIGIAD